MTPKKAKEKARRRARKLAEQAWEAADQGNLDLAEKIIRRAVATQPENPVLWNDQGLLLGLRGRDTEAAEAFRTAARLAPSYADPYANLAAMRARQGYVHDAVALMEKAVRYAQEPAAYAERLEAYHALAGTEAIQPLQPRAADGIDRPTLSTPVNDWSQRLAAFDWQRLGARLTREGCVAVPALLDAATCAAVRGLFDDESLFSKKVLMEREDFGRGEYRYFRAPIPAVVDELRRAVYPHVARIANEWQRLLNEPECYPAHWEDFRGVCAAEGQTVPTPILLKYGPGGFNALHRDLRGTVFFPIQMAVVLSPRADPADQASEGFVGGNFLLCDVPDGKKARRRVVPAGLGDAVLFCTRDRLVAVGGAYGLQPVNHGVAPITAGTGVVLGLPFHEYR